MKITEVKNNTSLTPQFLARSYGGSETILGKVPINSKGEDFSLLMKFIPMAAEVDICKSASEAT